MSGGLEGFPNLRVSERERGQETGAELPERSAIDHQLENWNSVMKLTEEYLLSKHDIKSFFYKSRLGGACNKKTNHRVGLAFFDLSMCSA